MVNFENYFTLFDLDQTFDIDLKQLRSSYRDLQIQYHPDKYSASSDAEKREAIQKSTLINDAYTTLLDVVLRAKYLVKLQSGTELKDNNLAAEPAFLLQQIEAREKLEEFASGHGSYDDLMVLVDDYDGELTKLSRKFPAALSAKNWNEASVLIAKMQLFAKLIEEAAELEDVVN